MALVSLVGKCHNNYFNENVNNNSLNLTNINNDYNSSASSLMSDKSAPDLRLVHLKKFHHAHYINVIKIKCVKIIFYHAKFIISMMNNFHQC